MTWTSPTQTKGVIDVKGIEGATRRDSVPIIAQIMAEIMQLLFPLEKNNLEEGVITDEERKTIIENIQRIVKTSVRKVLSGELDVGEFIMTRVWGSIVRTDVRGYGSGRPLVITKESKHISLWSIKCEKEIQEEFLKMANGIFAFGLTKIVYPTF